MAKNNPFFGGPNYTQWLAMWISGDKPNLMRPAPPGGGGQQISIRLKPDRLTLLDVISEKSGWSRNQVLEGMLDAALAQLFNELSERDAEQILNQTCERVIARAAQT